MQSSQLITTRISHKLINSGLHWYHSKPRMKGESVLSYVRKKSALQKPQHYTYLLILDFEATCDNNSYNELPVQEIIEFPVLKFNLKSLKVESYFHSFVRPRHCKELTDFCTSLTGIIQDEVDHSAYFPEVLSCYTNWHQKEIGNETFLAVTCGDWDLLSMLPKQCQLDKIAVPSYFRQWHNVKMSYCDVTKKYCSSLKGILAGLELTQRGRPHRGLDDCHNITNIVRALIQQGVVITPTNCLSSAVP